MRFNNMKLHNLNEYLCECNIYMKENMPTRGLELANEIFVTTLAPYPTDVSAREYGTPSEVYSSDPFCCGLGLTSRKSY
jgi:hypothetical protein